MPPVFAHGRLRLYLLKLLDEAPRHGYEVIRLLEERFQGLYAPSAGTVYPRLAKLEAEGLVSHTTEGGRKVYSLTDAGRAELAGRQGELTELEREIRESLAALAAGIREDVSDAAGDLRREVREAAERNRSTPAGDGEGWDTAGWESAWENVWEAARGTARGDKDALRTVQEEMRRAREQWQEQARRARQEAQQARHQARKARQARDAAREEALRIARQVQQEVQSQAQRGDWQGAVRTGMSELARHLGGLGGPGGPGGGTGHGTSRPPSGKAEEAGAPAPEWAEEPADPPRDPARELERLLDRFRDDVRDAARDHGVSQEQLGEVRRRLSAAAVHIVAVLRDAGPPSPER